MPPLVEVWCLHPRDPQGSACHLLSLRDQQRFPSTCSAGDLGLIPWVRKIPWRKAWQLTPVFWPGESHGQRSLAGCSPWGPKEPDMNQRLSTHTGKMCAFVGLCCYLSFLELILTSSALSPCISGLTPAVSCLCTQRDTSSILSLSSSPLPRLYRYLTRASWSCLLSAGAQAREMPQAKAQLYS